MAMLCQPVTDTELSCGCADLWRGAVLGLGWREQGGEGEAACSNCLMYCPGEAAGAQAVTRFSVLLGD